MSKVKECESRTKEFLKSKNAREGSAAKAGGTAGGGASTPNIAAPGQAAVEFARSLLGVAPASMLERANAALVAVAARRSLLPTDHAAAVGCLLVYYLDVESTVEHVVALNDVTSAQFLVSLAARVRTDVMRSDVMDGEPMLPSPSALTTLHRDRTKQLALDLDHASNDIAMGELSPDDTFTSASIALHKARERFALRNGAASAGNTAEQDGYPVVDGYTPLHIATGVTQLVSIRSIYGYFTSFAMRYGHDWARS